MQYKTCLSCRIGLRVRNCQNKYTDKTPNKQYSYTVRRIQTILRWNEKSQILCSCTKYMTIHTVRDEITRQYLFSPFLSNFCTIMRTPLPSRWSYRLLGSLGRTSKHAQTPYSFGFIRPSNVRCHKGHWSWSWHVWPQIEVYRVRNPILQETELGEYLSHTVGGVCVFGLLLPRRTQCVV
jgi:hypothetical protein